MESEIQTNKILQNSLLTQILTELESYYLDRSNLQVWKKIFDFIGLYITKDSPFSYNAQKMMSFYLENRPQSSEFGKIVAQHKEIICKIYDLTLTGSQSIDEAISAGKLREVVFKKLQKTLKDQPLDSDTAKLLILCVQSIVLHICQFLIKFQQANRSYVLPTNRCLPQIFQRKTQMCSSNTKLANVLFSKPITLMEGYLDNVKASMFKRLSFENLFEINSPSFKDKKAFLSGYISTMNSSKPEMFGKIFNLNTLLDSSCSTGQMVEKKLASLSNISSNNRWSLLSCIQQFQLDLNCIFERLPAVLKSLANQDVLSYLRNEFMPAYKYQVIKAGYIQGPFLCQLVEVLVNVGKNSIELVSFPYSKEAVQVLEKNQYKNIWKFIEKSGIKYSKLKLDSKSIGIISSNTFYLLAADPTEKNPNQLSQLIRWNILPKNVIGIKNTIQAMKNKKKMFNHYFFLPLDLAFLDFLNHQYTKSQNIQIVKTLINHLDEKILGQQKIVCKVMKSYPHIRPVPCAINYDERFCYFCHQSFLTFYCLINKREVACVNCVFSQPENVEVNDLCAIYHPNDLRDATIKAKIFVNKRKTFGEDIENKYEAHVCEGKFIGCYENEKCKGRPSQESQTNTNCPINSYKNDELYFSNKLKEMKLTTVQEYLISIALSKVPTNEQDRQALIQKIKTYIGSVSNIEELKKSICSKYDKNNNVMTVMQALTF